MWRYGKVTRIPNNAAHFFRSIKELRILRKIILYSRISRGRPRTPEELLDTPGSLREACQHKKVQVAEKRKECTPTPTQRWYLATISSSIKDSWLLYILQYKTGLKRRVYLVDVQQKFDVFCQRAIARAVASNGRCITAGWPRFI